MGKKSKVIPICSGQNSKLMILFTLGIMFCILIVIPAALNAEYNIYLKNGRVISGVEEIKHENGNVKIFKKGILLDMSKTNIIRIEEYKPAFVEKTQEEGGAESGGKPIENQLLDNTDYRKRYEIAPVEESAEETAGEEATESTSAEQKIDGNKSEVKDKVTRIGTGEFIDKEGNLQPGQQLKDLRQLKKDNKLPEQFKPYKDFLEKRYEQRGGKKVEEK